MFDTLLTINGVKHGTKDSKKAGTGKAGTGSEKTGDGKGNGLDPSDRPDPAIGGVTGPRAE